jgi:hypothetical protein
MLRAVPLQQLMPSLAHYCNQQQSSMSMRMASRHVGRRVALCISVACVWAATRSSQHILSSC